MNWKIRLVCMFSIILLTTAITACGKSSATLKDGYFTAEAAEFDSYGWKEYLCICVSGGKIIHVEYNAHNSSGFIKSWDMDYMRLMNAASGTYPNAYTRYYSGMLLELQEAAGFDALSGATESYHAFIRLAEAVLSGAREGNHKTILVNTTEKEG